MGYREKVYTPAELRQRAREEESARKRAKKIEGFTVNVWRAPNDNVYPNYSCSLCQYETLYAFKAVEHSAAGMHAWKRPAKRTRKVRADKGAVY